MKALIGDLAVAADGAKAHKDQAVDLSTWKRVRDLLSDSGASDIRMVDEPYGFVFKVEDAAKIKDGLDGLAKRARLLMVSDGVAFVRIRKKGEKGELEKRILPADAKLMTRLYVKAARKRQRGMSESVEDIDTMNESFDPPLLMECGMMDTNNPEARLRRCVDDLVWAVLGFASEGVGDDGSVYVYDPAKGAQQSVERELIVTRVINVNAMKALAEKVRQRLEQDRLR